jgi:serine phosphatase RsbU (regulator of sigma subunit)
MPVTHRLLQRQVKKHLGGEIAPELAAFVASVDEAYVDMDNDKAMVERSLELSSKELEELNDAVRKKQEELSAAMQQIMESLQYASRLQRAQLPQPHRFLSRLQDFAVLWSPRDTIGGDLWWISPGDSEGRFSIVVVDCTGHGVPGAMLSLLASTSLEQIYGHHREPAPAEALMQLDHAVRKGLNQDKPGASSDDGCDGAILQVDPTTQKIYFAGCRIDLYSAEFDATVVRTGAERFSMGYPDDVFQKPKQHEMDWQDNTLYVMSSDGLLDQVGRNEKGVLRSFGHQNLMKVLAQNASKGCTATINAVSDSLKEWQGADTRRDDVTVIAFVLSSFEELKALNMPSSTT